MIEEPRYKIQEVRVEMDVKMWSCMKGIKSSIERMFESNADSRFFGCNKHDNRFDSKPPASDSRRT